MKRNADIGLFTEPSTMPIDHHQWHSPSLDRNMALKIYDCWGHDVSHDWPWWYRQMNYFLETLDA
ncbi:MAG: hypothetical protein PVG51_17860 [Desulfosarcina sp.]|jgi:esterase/lipase superfamily enzyme